MEAEEVRGAVAEVIDAVRERGDAALCAFAERWDGVRLEPGDFRVSEAEIDRALAHVDPAFRQAFVAAVARIRRFHRLTLPKTWWCEGPEGEIVGQRWLPLDTVGLYVPGGKASYPSSLAMLAVAAQEAGVRRIVVATPPSPSGIPAELLAAAALLDAREIYRVGGAQAVAALAFGTETIPKVDKVFGPGNVFVAEAKRALYGVVGIDLVAGPSEVVVYADDQADPQVVAAELIAQAEHDEATRVIAIATSETALRRIQGALDDRLERETRGVIARRAIETNGRFLAIPEPDAAAREINRIAPEHLSLCIRDPWGFLPRIRHAGAIALGEETPVAFGDYYAGPNHVLPTGGTARFASSVSTESFMKRSNLLFTPPSFLESHADEVTLLASTEGLPGHAESIRVRRKGSKEGT
ncbi:MAG: histidinol dehydrogenase [Planctomycetes bacterium]|nr:histidinol dehydrogenase [Planctomycetota bacterium]